ncbi:MAG: glycoside hydrolase 100 family protein [Kouleothrix sp.]
MLYYAAALAHAELFRALPAGAGGHQLAIAQGIHERLNLLGCGSIAAGWPSTLPSTERLKSFRLEWSMLYHNIGTISSRPFYLPWVAFREYGDWCDSLGNLLAILTGVADGHRTEHILRFMHQVGMHEPYPTKAIHPPIYPGESNWREYYRSRNLNIPHQYHNGGIWLMIGGFHVAALVRHQWQSEAERTLVRLAKANRQGLNDEWEFNEWMHGGSGHPMGYGAAGLVGRNVPVRRPRAPRRHATTIRRAAGGEAGRCGGRRGERPGRAAGRWASLAAARPLDTPAQSSVHYILSGLFT